MAEQPLPFSAYGVCMYLYGVANAARHRPGPCMPLAPLLFQPHARCQVPKESRSGCHASSWTEEPCEWHSVFGMYLPYGVGRSGNRGGGQPCPFFCLFYFIGFSRQDRFGHTSIGVREGLGCGRLGQSGRWDTGGVLDVAGLGA